MNIDPFIRDNCIKVDVDIGLPLRVHKKFCDGKAIYRKIINKFYYLISEVIFQRCFTRKAFKLINKKEYDLLFPNNGIWEQNIQFPVPPGIFLPAVPVSIWNGHLERDRRQSVSALPLLAHLPCAGMLLSFCCCCIDFGGGYNTCSRISYS